MASQTPSDKAGKAGVPNAGELPGQASAGQAPATKKGEWPEGWIGAGGRLTERGEYEIFEHFARKGDEERAAKAAAKPPRDE